MGGRFGDYEVANVERFVGRGGGRSMGGVKNLEDAQKYMSPFSDETFMRSR